MLMKSYVCKCAVSAGCLDCLKYAYENGCEWDWGECLFVALGYPDCVEYLLSKKSYKKR